jgi:hypothetical protein
MKVNEALEGQFLSPSVFKYQTKNFYNRWGYNIFYITTLNFMVVTFSWRRRILSRYGVRIIPRSPHKALVQAQFCQISFLNLKYANTLDYFFQF